MEVVIVSACLLGLRTRHDGTSKPDRELLHLLEGRLIVPICPEQLGGLPTPRPRSEFLSDDGNGVLDGKAQILNEESRDVTENFILGAQQSLHIAKLVDAKLAYLKDHSPSCGSTAVWSRGELRKGLGVTTALFLREGIQVIAR